MSHFEEQLLALKEAITDLNFHSQIRIISQISVCIQQAKNREKVIQELLSINLPAAINDVISTQMTVLQPSMKLIHYLIDDYHFRNYQFLPILKNILRVSIFFVQSDEVKKFQLEFFDILAILDVLMKKFLSNSCHQTKDGMQATFVCVLKFIDLVLSHDCVELAVKNLMAEIYIHLLTINGIFKCTANNFELIMKIANMANNFLDRFLVEYKKDGGELWLYKILQMIVRIFESFVLSADSSDVLAIKVFENICRSYMDIVLEKLTSPDSTAQNLELFKLCISILNTILWTPACSRNFCSGILKRFVELNGDSIVVFLCKTSPKIRKHTTYSMKIFLSALATYSENTTSNKHSVLDTFLQCHHFNSIFELSSHEVMKSQKPLLLLYGSSFLRQKLSNPLHAHRVLENLLVILNHPSRQLDNDEIWNILAIFAYCSNYAALSELEYAGVQKTSEILFEQVSKTVIDIQHTRQPIDKYMISLAKEFCSNISIFNSMIFLYLRQRPNSTSSKVSRIIPTHNVLPLLMSSDYNQVENAVKILQRKHLTEEDLNFVVEQCFYYLKVEEVVIGAALNLIGANLGSISHESTHKIFSGTIAFLTAKQLRIKFSKECYLYMMKICVDLIGLRTKTKC